MKTVLLTFTLFLTIFMILFSTNFHIRYITYSLTALEIQNLLDKSRQLCFQFISNAHKHVHLLYYVYNKLYLVGEFIINI